MRYFFHMSDYMGDEPSHKFADYESDLAAVLSECAGTGDPTSPEAKEFAEELDIDYPLKEAEVIEYFEEINGDGQPLITIVNLTNEKVIVGG